MRFVGVVKLKTPLTGFTFVAGPPVRLITICTKPFAPNGILVATVAARNDESHHIVETQCPQLRHDPTKIPSVLGGVAISGAAFALKSTKKAVVNLTYRNALGQVIHSENRLINTGKRIDINLWRSPFESVDVSVTAPVNQGLSVQQGARLASAHDSSGNSGGAQTNDECYNCPPQNPDNGDNYSNYLGSISNPFQYYGFYAQYADSGSGLNYTGGNTFYYSGSDASGSGYYTDPSFTEPGGAGYYPMDNPGPAPVNGPGLYPKSRQAEVYKYMWEQQRITGREQVVLMTNEGVFLMPNTKNELAKFKTQGYPGINIKPGINGQKSFTYKNRLYYVEGIVHTHPPDDMYSGADGLSPDDINDCANFYKAPIFAITDEGIWKGRPNTSSPGERLSTDYRETFSNIFQAMIINVFRMAALTVSLVCCLRSSALSQKSTFSPQRVEIGNEILISSILKYKKNLTKHDVFVVSQMKHVDSTIFYISTINSAYILSKNIPLVYTQIDDQYIMFYSGVEQIVKIDNEDKTKFLSLFKNRLNNDLLADGVTKDSTSLGSGYDPIQVILAIKDGKKVYENFKVGFGPTGMPYLVR